MSPIKIITWNVRGIHTPARRYAVYSYLKRHSVHIALLQESHLIQTETHKLRRRWRGQLWATNYSTYARGTMIWIRPDVPFTAEETLIDAEGRYVFIKGKMDGHPIILGCMYAPNTEQATYLQNVSETLSRWGGYPWLIGGDFNSVLDFHLDRSFPPMQSTPATSNAHTLSNWLRQWHLTDVWRHRYSDSCVYSYYSAPHALHVRIDRIVGTAELLPLITNTDYMGRTHSDHNPQYLQIDWNKKPSPTPTWRLQPAALEDPVFRSTIGESIASYFTENTGIATSTLMEWDAFKVVLRGQYMGIQWNMRR